MPLDSFFIPVFYPNGKLISEIIAGFFIGAISNLLMNGLAGHGPETGRQLIGQILSGGLTGAAGSATFRSVMSALPAMNVFLSGAIAGGASGMAAGFIGAAGNALTYGADWTTAIANGIIGGAIGIPIGAASGALGNALNAWLCGANFKTGTINFEDIDASAANVEKLQTQQYLDDQFDELLQERLEELNLSQYKDIYNKITTVGTEEYGIVITDGPYYGKFANADNKIVNGFTTIGMYATKADIHISPRLVLQQDPTPFKVTFGHELIHALHYLNLGYNGLTTEQKVQFRIYTERVAYRFSFEMYLRNGQFSEAMNVISTAQKMNVWGIATSSYTYPYFLLTK